MAASKKDIESTDLPVLTSFTSILSSLGSSDDITYICHYRHPTKPKSVPDLNLNTIRAKETDNFSVLVSNGFDPKYFDSSSTEVEEDANFAGGFIKGRFEADEPALISSLASLKSVGSNKSVSFDDTSFAKHQSPYMQRKKEYSEAVQSQKRQQRQQDNHLKLQHSLQPPNDDNHNGFCC